MNVKVQSKDTSSDMPQFNNLSQAGLRRSSRLTKDKPEYYDGCLTHKLHSNCSSHDSKIELTLSTFQQKCMHLRELVHTLLDGSLNVIHEMILSIVDNETYHIKAMVNGIEVHQ